MATSILHIRLVRIAEWLGCNASSKPLVDLPFLPFSFAFFLQPLRPLRAPPQPLSPTIGAFRCQPITIPYGCGTGLAVNDSPP
eukprot:6143681-Amphidinium_carterae.1